MVRHFLLVVLFLSCAVSVGVTFGYAQDTDTVRKVVSKISPQYPTLARDIHIGGTVRVEAVVAPNGHVRTVEIVGGHPLLAQAAAHAVSQWRWEPAKSESRQLIELTFSPGTSGSPPVSGR